MNTPSPTRQLRNGLLLMVAVVAVGFEGYQIAGWPVLDSIYMVIITIFGVGYGETNEMTPELRIFTIGFIIAGCTILIYTVGAFINWLTEGQLQRLMGERKMEKDIEELNGHIVICGFGRIGRLLAEQLKSAEKPFLILDTDPKQIELIREAGFLYIEGDATEEDVLHKAHIEKASVMASVLPNDAANVFIVLSCRQLNPNLQIIARANQISSEQKLMQAGAHRVVIPAAIGADRIAHLILKPNAREVIEKDLHDNVFMEGLSEIGLEMDEIAISVDSDLVGSTLEDLETRGKHAFIVVAVRCKDGNTTIKPKLDTTLKPGDTLIVMSHIGVAPDFVRRMSKRELRYRGAAH
ncbi:potassium channel family protein [Cerasicoccus maritimus]|uniref:potassium channel family protein n=1 Tax=Cerasicoccus maritimus TaxID=490089 RepID=UPI002852B9A6|nr:NAD-binding protein [Cerasicoccus maritimus]